MRESDLPVSLSEVILNSTTATAAMGTITMIVKKMKRRPRNDIGPPMYRQQRSVPLQQNQGASPHEGYHRGRGAIAQLEERLDRTQEVGGSSPPSSTAAARADTRFPRRLVAPHVSQLACRTKAEACGGLSPGAAFEA